MRYRLIKLLKKADEYASGVCTDYDEAQEVCADYLLSEGVIVPPCKVGDVVYEVYVEGKWWLDFEHIVAYQITNITITQNKKGEWTKKYRAMRFFNGKTWDSQLNFAFDDLGKTVFPTKEEAERALAERNGSV